VIETIGLKHNGPVGRILVDKRFVLVEDRVYFAIKQMDQYVANKQDFVIGMRENYEGNKMSSRHH
jgi:hypothetical protein